MTATGLLLLGLYALALVPPLWLMTQGWLDAKWALGWDGGVLLLLWLQYRSLDSLALRAAAASFVGPEQAPELHGALEKLASLADVPKPRAAVVWSDVPDAFATGRNPQRSTVAITRGLVAALEPAELEAVLAHELSHVANRDGAVMTFASFPALSLREAIRAASWKLWVFGFPLMVLVCLFYLVGLGIMLTISRCREYSADRGAVLLTGAPEQLMSALQKIAGRMAEIPSADLRQVASMSAFFIVPTNLRALTHPPLEKRLARLADMARELGKPAPPRPDVETATRRALAGVVAFAIVFAVFTVAGLALLR